MLKRDSSGFGCKTEGNDYIGQRRLSKQCPNLCALGAQLNHCLRSRLKIRQQVLREASQRVKRQTVTIITRKKPDILAVVGHQLCIHRAKKLIIVNKQHVMRRTIHALQEAVTAIVNTVEHVREVIVVSSSYSITLRRRQNMIVKFMGENQ